MKHLTVTWPNLVAPEHVTCLARLRLKARCAMALRNQLFRRDAKIPFRHFAETIKNNTCIDHKTRRTSLPKIRTASTVVVVITNPRLALMLI